MVPSTIKVPVPFEFVFPHGALGLRVEPVVDFEKRGQGDDQARDRATGERLWQVVVMDLDPEAGKYGGSTEVRVKIAAPHQPVLPPSAVPGYPPAIEFTDVVLTPYVDSQRCKGHAQGAHRCRARLADPGESVSRGEAASASRTRSEDPDGGAGGSADLVPRSAG